LADIISNIINFFAAPIQGLCPANPVFPSFCIATSTLVIIAAALLLSLMTSSANRFLVNYKMVTSYRREYMSWTQAVRKAKKDGDEKQLDKLLRKQSAMVKMSTRANLEQMKTTAITFVPLLLLYRVLFSAFPSTTAVAYSPLFLPGAATAFGFFAHGVGFISMVYWYFLSSFAIGIPLSRLFGIQQFSLNPGDTSSN